MTATALPYVFAEAGKQNVSSLRTWLAFESAYYLLQFGLAGVVIAMVYGRRASRETTAAA